LAIFSKSSGHPVFRAGIRMDLIKKIIKILSISSVECKTGYLSPGYTRLQTFKEALRAVEHAMMKILASPSNKRLYCKVFY
jgi:hypothetical protein